MARHKDTAWNLPDGTPTGRGNREHSYPSIHAALLMDIRDELKRLNAAISCLNFQAIPSELRKIVRNTTKRRRRCVKR